MGRIRDLAVKAMSQGYVNTLKEEMKDAHGAVTISKIGFEAIGILVLVVIWMLIPYLGNAIQDAMGNIATTSEWANASSGADMWNTVAPILQTAVIVCIVGLILKVIYDLKTSRN